MDAFRTAWKPLRPGYHPMADGIAVESMRLLKGALARAVESPNDLEARVDMMPPPRWARPRSRKASAACMHWRIRLARCSIRTMG
jgi:alcohol dehydrogenase class IV